LNWTGEMPLALIASQTYYATAPTVNSNSSRVLTMGAGAPLASVAMSPPRPVFDAELGRFFVELRQQRGWTQRQAEDIAARRKLEPLTRQVLWRLEKGKTKNPEPEVLRAVADLYDLAYQDVVSRFVQRRFGVVAEDDAHGPPRRRLTASEAEWLELLEELVRKGKYDLVVRMARTLVGRPEEGPQQIPEEGGAGQVKGVGRSARGRTRRASR
jgi:transcriptional regulator with XRE-family HTH domain